MNGYDTKELLQHLLSALMTLVALSISFVVIVYCGIAFYARMRSRGEKK